MRTAVWLLGLTLPAWSLAPVNAAEPLKLTGQTMGTYYSIVVDANDDAVVDGSQLQERIEARLAEINRQMSTWDDTSEISRFNQSTSTDWFDVTAEFAIVAEEARAIHQNTDGAFDPTVAPLIDLWGFGSERRKGVPEDADIQQARTQMGMQHLQVRRDPPAIKKAIPELQLNLSAIAKGYGVDAIAELLIESGHASFVVDIGGENRAGAQKATGQPWRLGVESPLGGLHRVMELTDSAIATSGDYRNNFQLDGVTYSHAIDPSTGWPVRNPPASVSVVHTSCMTADAWATAMMILGPEKGGTIAKANDLSVMFQTVHSDQTVVEESTGLFVQDAADVSEVIVEVEDDSTAEVSDVEQPAAEASDAMPWFPFVAAAVIFLVAITGMAAGTILQKKSLKGSCGGLSSMPGSDGKSICELCTVPKDECTNAELREKMQAAAASQCADES